MQTAVLQDTSHTNSRVILRFPQLVGVNLDKVNDRIQQACLHYATEIYGEGYTDLEMQVDYHLTFHSDEWVSITFHGYANIQSAPYPVSLIKTMNFHLQDGTRIKLGDIYTIDLSFVKRFRKAFTQQFKNTAKPEDSDTWQGIVNAGTDAEWCTYLKNADLSTENEIQSYLTADKIGISVGVLHALGDHFEVEIPYSELVPYLKIHDNLFRRTSV